MTILLTPTEDDAIMALRSFMSSVLPSSVDVIRGQINRVPEPADSDFIVMWPIMRRRLETNVDQFVDTKGVGSIAGNLMTVTGLSYGSLQVGSVVFSAVGGTGVVFSVQSQVSGSVGGTGVYSVAPSGSVGGGVLAAGVLNALAPTELTIQLDVHGPNGGDNAQIVSTMLRDDFACQAFKVLNVGVVPLYANDPKQITFQNENQQIEERWIVEACFQVNTTVNDIPQQFFDSITVERVPADIEFPA